MTWQGIKRTLTQTMTGFLHDDAMSQAAALAFYTALGLAPMLLHFLAVSAWLGEGAKQGLITQIEETVGPQAGESVEMIVRSAEQQESTSWVAAAIGIATMLFSASGIFAQLQSALNRIWNVRPKPGGSGWWQWLRSRLLSVGLLFALLFLMLVSLVLSTAINLMLPSTGMLWNLVNLVVSVLVFALLFAVVFRYLPDAQIAWRDVAIGALLTAVLFALGKYGIGLYLGHSSVASGYGAAGSLVVLMAWVYYSAIILLLGAELTQAQATQYGRGIRPAAYAESTVDPAAPGKAQPAAA